MKRMSDRERAEVREALLVAERSTRRFLASLLALGEDVRNSRWGTTPRKARPTYAWGFKQLRKELGKSLRGTEDLLSGIEKQGEAGDI